MSTRLLRVLKYGVQLFARHAWLSVATITVMILALMMYEGLILFTAVTDTAISSLQDKIDIAVYFKTAAPEDDILKIQKSLEGLPEVKNVEYISRDQALEVFKANHKDDPNINQALAELEDNPLRASLNIKAHDPKDYPTVAAYLENEGFEALVEKVTFSQNKAAIDKLNNVVDTMHTVGFAVTLFIAFAASLVAFNTIRLAIYSNREEIGIERLVGASNNFIKGPYVIAGILYGIAAAIISLVLLMPVINFSSPYLNVFIPELNLSQYFYTNILLMLFYLVLFGAGLGILSSWVAIRRYLRV